MAFTPIKFLIGSATAAIQIESGNRANNWYDWEQAKHPVKDGSSPDASTDHWDKWQEDTQLMADLGLQIYRLSLEWARIEPRPGQWDQAALDHYRAEIEMVREKGMIPLVTLHHFTNPSWFQGLGEWTREENLKLWLRYVAKVVKEFQDIVDEWVTINEPNVYATAAYLFHEGPPGTTDPLAMRRVLINMARGHIRAYRLIHKIQPEAKVGFAHHVRSFDPLNPSNPWHRFASKFSEKVFQNWLAEAALGGKFNWFMGGQPRDIRPGKYYDFVGVNYYTRTASKGFADGVFPGVATNDLGWEVYPEGMIRTCTWLNERFPGPIWITENGTADNGVLGAGYEGVAPSAEDVAKAKETGESRLEGFRCRLLDDHFKAMAQSALPFERYYHWCFVDNWEWVEGLIPRFGMVYNHYSTQTRVPKPSAYFLADIIKNGGVTDEARARFVETQQYHHC